MADRDDVALVDIYDYLLKVSTCRRWTCYTMDMPRADHRWHTPPARTQVVIIGRQPHLVTRREFI